MTEPTIGALFAGYAGLEMGVQRVLGGTLAWYSEIAPAACRVLGRRYPSVPNLGDVTAVDWSAVQRPNILTGGFPCTDVSSAGRRGGLRSGTQSGLWANMAIAVQELRPDLVVIENVRGILSTAADGDVAPCPWCVGDDESVALRALGCVLGDLADVGFDAEWCGLRASDVGAPHARFRVVVLAWPATDPDGIGSSRPGRTWPGWCGSPHHDPPPTDSDGKGRQGAEPASGSILPARGVATNAPCDGWHGRWLESARIAGGSDVALGGDEPDELCPTCGDPGDVHDEGGFSAYCGSCTDPLWGRPDDAAADSNGHPVREQPERPPWGDGLTVAPGGSGAVWGNYEPAIRRWERILGRSAPAPTSAGKRGGQQLSPLFVEWMMGLPEGWVTGVPDISRNDALKMLGNGVVPHQIEAGIRHLLSRIESEFTE